MSPPDIAETLETPMGDAYDLIVAGGGASGLIAAIAAARLGARTLLIEREGCLGGTATIGYVAQFVGFFNGEVQAVWGLPFEFTRRIQEAGGSDGFAPYTMAEAAADPLTLHRFPFNPEIVKMVADDMAAEAGIDVLLHASVVDVLAEGGSIGGVVTESISGRKAHAAPCVIDATGDAVIAERAGVAMQDQAPGDGHARQPNALCFRLSNVDVAAFRALSREFKREKALQGIASGELFWESMSFVSTPGGSDAICLMSRLQGLDPLDEIEASELERQGRAQVRSIVGFLNREVPGFERAILAGIAPRVGIRETRRIKGQFTLTVEDILGGRRFEDAIALGCGPLDVHEPDGTGIALSMPPAPFEIPMRCLVPEATEGLLVTGRAISATQEANGGARHMGTAMALGQAAGVMAAIAAAGANSTLAIPHAPVRAALRDQGAAVSVADCEDR